MNSEPSSSTSFIPTGESQVGVVPKGPKDTGPVGDNAPVIEHPVEVPEADPASRATPAATAEHPEAESAPRAQAPAQALAEAPEAHQPEPVLSEPIPSRLPEVAVSAPALQETPQVPIPVRVSQLTTEHKRLRTELDALEQALKKTMN